MAVEEQLFRGDIWLVDFGAEPRDPEQALVRPAVIVSENRLHHPNLKMVIVVPGTSTIRGIPLHVVCQPDRANGLSTETAFQIEQVRALSTERLIRRVGRLHALELRTIDETLRSAFDL
ncbi:type II toxin-antitoxin system PemK/MazF family toxin [Candidatus Poriferisodalis sp.]|uniref:type II toxin-antitoxin system PemK/MazF family toxin n=1 Tax=Candidatus Poriferisodalis sp. TaxID=3101277 RepID=UPI003B027615